MTLVAAGPVIKVLLGISWFRVQVSANLAFIVDYLDVKKRDICGRCCLFKFDMWINSVTMVKEYIKLSQASTLLVFHKNNII